MIELLNELDGFRGKRIFKKYGFGLGGPHNPWIKGVEKLSRSKEKKVRKKASVLANIGYAYAMSKGVDTDHIKELRDFFNELL